MPLPAYFWKVPCLSCHRFSWVSGWWTDTHRPAPRNPSCIDTFTLRVLFRFVQKTNGRRGDNSPNHYHSRNTQSTHLPKLSSFLVRESLSSINQSINQSIKFMPWISKNRMKRRKRWRRKRRRSERSRRKKKKGKVIMEEHRSRIIVYLPIM